jgi:hypothetical protein
MPVSLANVPIFEKQNNISINVFCLEKDEIVLTVELRFILDVVGYPVWMRISQHWIKTDKDTPYKTHFSSKTEQYIH